MTIYSQIFSPSSWGKARPSFILWKVLEQEPIIDRVFLYNSHCTAIKRENDVWKQIIEDFKWNPKQVRRNYSMFPKPDIVPMLFIFKAFRFVPIFSILSLYSAVLLLWLLTNKSQEVMRMLLTSKRTNLCLSFHSQHWLKLNKVDNVYQKGPKSISNLTPLWRCLRLSCHW